MPPESFLVLKSSFIKKNVAIHKMKECKRNAINTYQENLRSGTLISSIEVLFWR